MFSMFYTPTVFYFVWIGDLCLYWSFDFCNNFSLASLNLAISSCKVLFFWCNFVMFSYNYYFSSEDNLGAWGSGISASLLFKVSFSFSNFTTTSWIFSYKFFFIEVFSSCIFEKLYNNLLYFISICAAYFDCNLISPSGLH